MERFIIMNQHKINQAIEAICATGCQSVNAFIKTLESGQKSAGLEDFDETELQILTNELKAIMAVYESAD